MSDAGRIADLERRVAALEEFALDVKMGHLADWMEAHLGEIARSMATGEPVVLPASGAVITAEELRAAAAEAKAEGYGP